MFDTDELRALATDSKYHTVQVSSRELLELLDEYDRLVEIEAAARNECEELKVLMAALLDELGERDHGDGNAPGHCHEIPGVWDSDNGKKAGKPCSWCAIWAKAKSSCLMTPND